MKRFILGMMFLVAMVSIAATLPAQLDTVRATVTTQQGQQLVKSVTVSRIFGQPVTVSLYKDVAIVQGVRVGVLLDGTADSLAIPRCVYVVVTDQQRNELPGLTGTLATTDTIAAHFIPIPQGVTSPCPTKSIRLADIPVPVPVFQSVLTGGIAPPGTLVIGGRP